MTWDRSEKYLEQLNIVCGLYGPSISNYCSFIVLLSTNSTKARLIWNYWDANQSDLFRQFVTKKNDEKDAAFVQTKLDYF